MMDNYGLRWVEVDKKEQVVTKQKFFQTEKALKKFIEKIQLKENFIRLESTTGI